MAVCTWPPYWLVLSALNPNPKVYPHVNLRRRDQKQNFQNLINLLVKNIRAPGTKLNLNGLKKHFKVSIISILKLVILGCINRLWSLEQRNMTRSYIPKMWAVWKAEIRTLVKIGLKVSLSTIITSCDKFCLLKFTFTGPVCLNSQHLCILYRC